LYSQGAGRNALSAAIEAARAGADLIACATYPVALAVHRVSAEAAGQALGGLGFDTGIDLDVLWQAAELADESIGGVPIEPLLPRISLRAARRGIPLGIVAAVDAQLRARGASDRLDEVLDELDRVRVEAGSLPLAAPIGQIIGSQALVNVLGASRYSTIVDELRDLASGRFGRTPGPIEPALARAVELLGVDPESEADFDSVREEAKGLAASEEELLLLALFGEEAEVLLRSIRERSGGEESLASAGVDQLRAERIRDVVKIVQESGIGEITVEEDGMRVRVRRAVDVPVIAEGAAPATAEGPAPAAGQPSSDWLVRIESPMVGTFYSGAAPTDPPFVHEGDAVVPGQTLCILEAMKLMNEVKAEIEAVVRKIHVGNGEPVEYGQLLLELEPLQAPPATV
jgi:oxaloacetate decarboxylase alpha subunit